MAAPAFAAVTQPPTLVAGTSPMSSITEDAGAPGPGDGTLVSDIVDLCSQPGGDDNVSDPNAADPAGMAITAVNGNGPTTCLWTSDDGITWTPVPTVSAASAMHIAALPGRRLFCHLAPNGNGTLALTFLAWDGSNGKTDGSTGSTAGNGSGTSAYSATSANAQE